MRASLIRLCRAALAVSALALATQGPAAAKDIYGDIADRIHRLDQSPYVAVTKIGASRLGRPIYAVTLTNPENPESICHNRTRILVLSGQHGDEPMPVRSALAYLEATAAHPTPARLRSLKSTVMVFVPVVNPDGLVSHSRTNAAEADLNRDWTGISQPETRAVLGLYKSFKPHVVIDQHEWTAGDPYKPNCIEAPAFGKDAPFRLARMLAYSARTRLYDNNLLIRPTYYIESSDPRMAHRHFARNGICALLVETSSEWADDKRILAYNEILQSVVDAVNNPTDSSMAEEINIIKRSHGDALASIASGYMPKPQTPASYPAPAYWVTLGTAVLVTALLAIQNSKRRESAQPIVTATRQRHNKNPRLTDVVSYDIPVHARLAIIHELRQRPSDRQKHSIAA